METPADLAAVHEPIKIIRKKKLSGQQKREELEREVSMLRKMLDHEQKVHQILERVNYRHEYRPALSVPNFLPPKAKELRAELAMVEDEIARLEGQIGQLQSDLNQEKEVTKEYKSKKLSLNDDHPPLPPPPPPRPRPRLSSPSLNFNPNSYKLGRAGERSVPAAFETKALHFISKAINGDYSLNDFTLSEKPRKSGASFVDHMENNFRDEGGFYNKGSRKSGVLKPPSPLREFRHPTPRRERNVEFSLDFPPKHLANTSIQPEEETIQKWPPNKLAESIMKCLIFVFVRLLRTSRAMEMERSGPISRSANFSLSSRSFRVDTAVSSTSKPSLLQKVSKQQDPYGIFNAEESIPRDIGPYKNLVVFTARNLDPNCISNSSSTSLLQRLRVLMNSLQKVDLRFLTYQQKLAFWINIYNACIMHGFLQYGVPSSPEKLLTLMNKATMNVGGNTINAHAIEHFILRKPTTSSILKEVYRKGDKEDKEAIVREVYGLESLDPNVTFSLCCGTSSSPAVRIYTADGVTAELEKSKLEYLQASIMVTSTKRIALPELLLRHMRDFAQDTDSLVEWVCHQLPTSGSLRKSMVDCFRSLNGTTAKMSTIVHKIPYDYGFQYLLPS